MIDRHRTTVLALLGIGAALLGGGCAAARESQAPAAAPLRLNDIQVLASHNSYKQAMDPALAQILLASAGEQILTLDYAHAPLDDQLERGIRKLELDVFHDPEGGRYAAPGGLGLLVSRGLPHAPFDAAAMQAPGFKVLHVQDIDFRSHCPTLLDCLTILQDWSDRHPGHLPIMVSINAKDAPLQDPAAVVPLPFDAAAWAALDAEILAVIGAERLLRPDDVRGTRTSLREAVLADGWPELDAVRGRFLFVLDEPLAKLESYAAGHPGLRGRVMFGNFPETHPAAAFLVINDPLAEGSRIRAAVAAGFLVRTRADADTQEARSGAVARRDAAFASGAHFVSTDYYVEDPRFGTGYRVVLPGGRVARCNPVRTTDSVGRDCAAVRVESGTDPSPARR
ncbi:MAG: phosphatidylinositol-specific phospholipase C1-like protein [Pseudomonadales bacterium]|nr:phosphatidylinositol-specific phospholipase C1-like protein [Pseudomonadales bacterium]